MIRHALILVLVLSAVLPAQGGAANRGQQEEPTSIKRSDLVVAYYRMKDPDLVSATDLQQAAQTLYGRTLLVDEGPGHMVTRNIFVVGNAVAVCETAARAREIMKELPRMEEAAAPPVRQRSAAPQDLRTEYVELEYATAAGVHGVLGAYQRRVPPAGADRGSNEQVDNIVIHRDRNALVIRDTAGMIAEIKGLIARVDVEMTSRDQVPVTLTCHVVRASEKPVEGGGGLSASLVRDLGQLVSWQHFESLGTGVIRAGGHSRNVRAEIALADRHQCSLQVAGLAYRAKEGVLTLGKVDFRLHGATDAGKFEHALETSTEIKVGEDTVIGAFGKMPYFLLIRCTPNR